MIVEILVIFALIALGGLIELAVIYRLGRWLARRLGDRMGYYTGNVLIFLGFMPFFVKYFQVLRSWGTNAIGVPPWGYALGVVLVVSGLLITWIGVHTLSSDRWWSKPKFQKERREQLVDTGIYSILRHPTYLGQILMLYGLALLVDLQIALVSAACLHIYLAFIHARIEEQRCIEIFGDQYREYVNRTDAIIPWRALVRISLRTHGS
ncbi:MAG: isoprenylcysteine carboxylmethyltransferase family protein [Symbiobacterium sp.]|uniref:isoprenylcysteine carboxylmethyltransferase family protein n=1 Tax=Symbiobacterium sp. TaxID=1971213 RepID=UPI003464A7D6